MIDWDTAERLLKDFPALWTQIHEAAEDALEGGGHAGIVTTTGGGGGYSDSTGERAVRLAEASELADRLMTVRRWIDEELAPRDRPLLLAVWRMRDFGWRWVAREVGTDVLEVQVRWCKLVDKLSAYLNRHSAGNACGQHGTAYVTGPQPAGRE